MYYYHYVCAKSLQLCQTLCDPMDCSPPSSSVHGILQARILEWVVISFFRGSSWPRDRAPCPLHLLHWQVNSLPLVPPGKPIIGIQHFLKNKWGLPWDDTHNTETFKVECKSQLPTFQLCGFFPCQRTEPKPLNNVYTVNHLQRCSYRLCQLDSLNSKPYPDDFLVIGKLRQFPHWRVLSPELFLVAK